MRSNYTSAVFISNSFTTLKHQKASGGVCRPLITGGAVVLMLSIKAAVHPEVNICQEEFSTQSWVLANIFPHPATRSLHWHHHDVRSFLRLTLQLCVHTPPHKALLKGLHWFCTDRKCAWDHEELFKLLELNGCLKTGETSSLKTNWSTRPARADTLLLIIDYITGAACCGYQAEASKWLHVLLKA